MISLPETAITHLLVITSKEEELKERNTPETCSPAIFSASSKDLSRLFLNSSISRIFPFLIAFDEAIPTHKMWKLFASSWLNFPMTVLIFEVPISIAVIVELNAIFNG